MRNFLAIIGGLTIGYVLVGTAFLANEIRNTPEDYEDITFSDFIGATLVWPFALIEG